MLDSTWRQFLICLRYNTHTICLFTVYVPLSTSAGKVTTKAADPSPPTTIPAEHTSAVNAIIARITAAKSLFDATSSSNRNLSTSAANADAMWVLRRHGYTKQENPHNSVSVMKAGYPLIPYHQYSALVPSMYDILVLIDSAVKAGKGKPGAVAVDVEYAIEALQALLQPTGVHVIYYPPPSAEEEAYNNMTNPYLSPAERMSSGPVCAVCRSSSGSTGSGELMRCGRCKDEYYCCKEHQKAHWKKHKHVCVQV